ncbi:hypothetical protein [Tepidiforma sp.]|uniref:hypothetical protein n=1 Tax=Tepidiforma sp. TaxID=2682230 RepID=UPI002ADE68ED|nr:hypothetical protein [Tepidiforma sp.]
MNPPVPRVLQGVAANLLTEVMREIRTPFGQQLVGIAAVLNLMAAEEFERAADRLVEENRIVRKLLADGLALLGEAAPAGMRDALGAPPAASLRISDLQRENDLLRAGLIELHAAVEATPGDAARALESRIWDELIESTRRRHFASRP